MNERHQGPRFQEYDEGPHHRAQSWREDVFDARGGMAYDYDEPGRPLQRYGYAQPYFQPRQLPPGMQPRWLGPPSYDSYGMQPHYGNSALPYGAPSHYEASPFRPDPYYQGYSRPGLAYDGREAHATYGIDGRHGMQGLQPDHRGRGPKNYTRTDDRIREDLSERLSEDAAIDASDIEVHVKDGTVKLTGAVETRWMKHRAEDLAERCGGVRDIDNQLHVKKPRFASSDHEQGSGRDSHDAGGKDASSRSARASSH